MLQTIDKKDETSKVLNGGSGNYENSNIVKPLFTKMREH